MIFKWRGDYFYGYFHPSSKEPKEIYLWTRVAEKGEKYKFVKKEGSWEDPEGNKTYDYSKRIDVEEQEDPEIPRRYPGDYHWIWYNGAFFKVMSETEKYVLVRVGDWRFDQADALGIKREDVISERYQPSKIGSWWLRKVDIKMPDEFGKGKYVYMEVMGPFYNVVAEVVKRSGEDIRVRRKIVHLNRRDRDYRYDEMLKYKKAFLLSLDVEEITEHVDMEVWKEGDDMIYVEMTFNLETLRRYRAMIKDEMFDGHYLDFYLYGEEEVPYRL